MCSIIASFDKQTLKDLVKLNQFRGSFSYSIMDLKTMSLHKDFGKYQEKHIESCTGFVISHLQLPTGGLIQDINRIHPTIINDSYLYHNGIITPRGMKYMQNYNNQGLTETFDTKLLHNHLYNSQDWVNELSNIEGLFACVYIRNNKIYLFRTKHGKLYIDKDMSISSERFDNSKCINYDTVYELNLQTKSLIEIGKFKTNRYNIIVPGEL